MIKINLLGDETVIDTSGTWVLIGYVLSVVVLLIICGAMYLTASAAIEEGRVEADTLAVRLKKLQEVTKEVRELEARKKELSDKTSVIAVLKKNKLGPVRILDDLNTALPDRAWLAEIRETGGLMRISGYALDNQTIAAFMKALEVSTYFESVDLGESREVDRNGAKIKEFTLLTKVVYAGGVKKAVEPPSALDLAALSPSQPQAGEVPSSTPRLSISTESLLPTANKPTVKGGT